MWIDEQTAFLLKNTIGQEGWIELPSFGKSMFPLIRQGEVCRFAPVQSSTVKKGDILLFYTDSYQLVAHRFLKKEVIDGKLVFIFKGDSNLGYDEPIPEEQILGQLTAIFKKNKTVHAGNVLLFLWGKLLMNLPVLSLVLQKYLKSNWVRGSK